MARETAVGFCRNLTQGQLTALLLVQAMEARAAGGERFASRFMVLARKRQWEALAAMACLFSNGGTTPSSRDFRYAVPRDRLLLSLKICCALLVLILAAAGTLWLSQSGAPHPVPAPLKLPIAAALMGFAGDDLDNLDDLHRATDRAVKTKPPKPRATARKKNVSSPDHARVAADVDNHLRALAILELERRTGHEALSSDEYRELLQEMGKSNAEIEAALEEFPEPVWRRP